MAVGGWLQAYLWCEAGPTPQSLPAVIAQPWVSVSRALDMPPVLVYSTYNLLNWRRLDPAQPIELGNIVCLAVSRPATDSTATQISAPCMVTPAMHYVSFMCTLQFAHTMAAIMCTGCARLVCLVSQISVPRSLCPSSFGSTGAVVSLQSVIPFSPGVTAPHQAVAMLQNPSTDCLLSVVPWCTELPGFAG